MSPFEIKVQNNQVKNLTCRILAEYLDVDRFYVHLSGKLENYVCRSGKPGYIERPFSLSTLAIMYFVSYPFEVQMKYICMKSYLIVVGIYSNVTLQVDQHMQNTYILPALEYL